MRVVLSNGCFDPCHYGHLLHLREAKAMGDYLVVSLTSDESVAKEKGEGRPVFNEEERADFLRELRCVDGIVVVSGVMEALDKVKPDVFVKGPDYVGSIGEDALKYCRKNKISIRFTTGPKWSSTELLDEYRRG